MSDCNETLRDLEQYLDGEIPSETHQAIQHHLDGCLDCLQAFDFHAELREVIAQKCRDEELPPGLLSRIEQCFGEDFDGDGRIG